MVCTPNSPKCDICPVKKYCTAYQQGCVAEFPVRPIKQVKPVRYGTVFFIRNEAGELLFERRPDKGLLGGMIGLPGTSWDSDPSKLVSPYVANDIILSPVPDFHVTHTFTHFQLRLGANIANCQKVYKSPSSFWHRPEEYDKIGLPNLFRKAIKQYMAI